MCFFVVVLATVVGLVVASVVVGLVVVSVVVALVVVNFDDKVVGGDVVANTSNGTIEPVKLQLLSHGGLMVGSHVSPNRY